MCCVPLTKCVCVCALGYVRSRGRTPASQDNIAPSERARIMREECAQWIWFMGSLFVYARVSWRSLSSSAHACAVNIERHSTPMMMPNVYTGASLCPHAASQRTQQSIPPPHHVPHNAFTQSNRHTKRRHNHKE